MRRTLLVSLRMAVVTIVLTGIIYPLVVWGIGTLAFPEQAAGSLITDASGTVIGSKLIGQSFSADKYFHPRPSAAGASGYDAMSSGASNLGPTSQTLISEVETRVADAVSTDGAAKGAVPVDMVTASGSGLDPDISPDNAYLQVARVANARGMSAEAVRHLVEQHVTKRQLGFLGEPRVNVLELNLALDALSSN
ncbi:MAG: potassium-transporting ATPase subunit KdpC [Coriobacteriia bacterium]|nr:potassium-transporting ATPase subunit KdpC [Coriobacteriia bacterium]